jgi:hypothetical protein
VKQAPYPAAPTGAGFRGAKNTLMFQINEKTGPFDYLAIWCGPDTPVTSKYNRQTQKSDTIYLKNGEAITINTEALPWQARALTIGASYIISGSYINIFLKQPPEYILFACSVTIGNQVGLDKING